MFSSFWKSSNKLQKNLQLVCYIENRVQCKTCRAVEGGGKIQYIEPTGEPGPPEDKLLKSSRSRQIIGQYRMGLYLLYLDRNIARYIQCYLNFTG